MKRLYNRFVLWMAFRMKDRLMDRVEVYSQVSDTLNWFALSLYIFIIIAINSIALLFGDPLYSIGAALIGVALSYPFAAYTVDWAFGSLGRDVHRAYLRFRDLERQPIHWMDEILDADPRDV